MFSQNKTRPILQSLALLVILLSALVEASDNGYAWQDRSTNNVSPSTAIVVIVLVLGFFITGAIFIYIQHCVVTPSTTTTTTTTTANNAVRGLDKSLIDTFPEFQYSAVKELKLGKGDLECAVCLSEFQDDETLRFLPNCDHVFHSECIDTWLAGHHTCPVCRDDLAIIHEPALPVSNDEVQIAMPAQDEMATLQNKNGRLPRSHSTGHSLVQPGEVHERFTLRLPTEIRRQLLARAKFRAMSLVVLPRQSSSRKGYRGEGSGSSRYSRFFGRSFIMRMGSFKSTAKIGTDGDFPPRPLPV